MTKREDLMALANEYNELAAEYHRSYEDYTNTAVVELKAIEGNIASTSSSADGICISYALVNDILNDEPFIAKTTRRQTCNTEVGDRIRAKDLAQYRAENRAGACFAEIAYALNINDRDDLFGKDKETFSRQDIMTIVLQTIETMRGE